MSTNDLILAIVAAVVFIGLIIDMDDYFKNR